MCGGVLNILNGQHLLENKLECLMCGGVVVWCSVESVEADGLWWCVADLCMYRYSLPP